MNQSEYAAKTPSTEIGVVVALRFFLRRLGRSTAAGILSTLIVAGLAFLAPSVATGAFTRPFLRQISGTPSGGFIRPAGVAVDAEDDPWVSELGESGPPYKLDQFESSEHENVFLKTLEIEGLEPPEPEGLTPPESVAINRSTGSFYTAGEATQFAYNDVRVEIFDGTGAFVKRCGPFGPPAYVAFDNSTDPSDPSAGSFYVSHTGLGFSPSAIDKFNGACEPVPFTGLEGNQIVGPGGASIALDSQGDIFVGAEEYAPSGLSLRSFNGNETPGLGENHKGFGGELKGVALDPVSDHLLISVMSVEGTEGAVDEFDAATGKFVNQITGTFPGAHLHSPQAMGIDSTGHLYVVDNSPYYAPEQVHVVDVYGPGHFLASLRLGQATQRTATSAVLNGSIDPEGLTLSNCHFEYVTEAAFEATGFEDLSSGGEAACVPAAASIRVDSEYHHVEAEVTKHIVSGTTYRYRLVATTEGALGGSVASGSLAFTAPHAPRIDATFADNLSSTFADLHAQIDPLGADTTYQFQYLTEAAYQANGASFSGSQLPTTVPATLVDIGSGGPTGSSEEAVLQQIGGLQTGTAYRFHVIATNECEPEHHGKMCITEGGEATFTTLPRVLPGLPDSRAYELVTPPNKGSAEDMFGAPLTNNEFFNRDFGYSSESGDGFLLDTPAAFGPFPASGRNAYVLSRAAGSWKTISLASPSLGVQSLEADIFNPSDLSQVGITDLSGSAGSEAGLQAMSLVGPPGGPYSTLHVDSPKHFSSATAIETETEIVGASHDLSHVVLESLDHTLAPGAETQDKGSDSLYEWAAGRFKLLNVNSSGSLLNRCGAVLGQGTHEGVEATPGKTHNAVSDAGSKVVFTAPDPNAKNDGPGCWNGSTGNAPQLYMRFGHTTLELSAPEPGVVDPTGRHFTHYVGASEDGSKIFFVTESELTKEAEETEIHDPELYEYDTETSTLTRISAGESGHSAGDVYVVPAVSADGSAVYFLANGVLASNRGADGSEATPGTCSSDGTGANCNLYRYATASGATSYVATVGRLDWGHEAGFGIGLAPHADWETTPNGRYLLFASSQDLTGYSTAAPASPGCPAYSNDAGSYDATCAEVYRYDSATGGLACLSCNPSGAPPVSNAEFTRSTPARAISSADSVRAISNDGSYVFFDTADSLVPQDSNGTLDVYEWHEGTISLISSGHDSAASFFLGASPDGSNVFFGTHARLVPADTDTAGDLYDARVCTPSNPCIQPPSNKEGLCEGDACQHPFAAPNDETPSSLTYHGPGNERPTQHRPRCGKGKVRRYGKCVKKARIHHKVMHGRAANTNRRAGR